MALTPDEQELLRTARAALPAWASDDHLPNESLSGYAKILGAAKSWFFAVLGQMGYIGHATGPVAGGPDWLGEHARDRGTFRQDGENDATLRERLWNAVDMVTEPAIQASVDAILSAAGIVGSARMYELRGNTASLANNIADQGTGGTFAAGVAGFKFTPDAGFADNAPPLAVAERREQVHKLVISGAANAGNNGTFIVTEVEGNGAVYVNGAGVAAVDAGVTWRVDRYTESDAILTAGVGRPDSYLSRGYRLGAIRPTIICQLPAGTAAQLAEAIKQHILSICGAGVGVVVEHNP